MLGKRAVTLIALACLTAASIASLFLPDQEDHIVTKASPQEIQHILSEEIGQVFKKIELENIEVSMPVDGKGARILVRVEKGARDAVPDEITIEVGDRILEVPLEVSETYEPYSAQKD